MNGTGLPLATPFTTDGALDEPALRDLVGWVEDRGIDFIVPCGSNSEAPLMSVEERARVVETVVEKASVPVMAGTGHPGLAETRRQTDLAAEAGADAALVVTPFYYNHDQVTLAHYFRDLADASDLPVYLYSVPVYTDVRLDPETVGRLAAHENVHGMKDSSGDLDAFQRIRARTADQEFAPLVGSGGVYAHALDAGAAGGILGVANVVPELASEVYDRHAAGAQEEARRLNRAFVELNRAVTATHGVPGMKAAMRARGAPAGHARPPFRSVDAGVRAEIEELLDTALEASPAPPS